MSVLSPQVRHLASHAWRQLERVVERFEKSWEAGSRPALDDYLPGNPTVRPALLIELAHADLEFRLRGGEPARAEDYLRKYPELGDDPTAALELIVSEYRLRSGAEAPRSIEEYLERFPKYGAALRARLEESAASIATPAGTPHTTPSVAATSPYSPESAKEVANKAPRVHLREPRDEPDLPLRTPSDALPPWAGRCRILGEIAHGGMGAVLKGHDPDLGRDLAVKVLLDQYAGESDLVRRFLVEAQVGGQLQHPGTVPVYELGRLPDQRPYFTMKLVRGRTLAALLAERADAGQDLPRFLKIFEPVCQTLAYAHARGVVHRDLKPANVMVGAFGEVQVMDWGIAKVLDSGREGEEIPHSLGDGEVLTQAGSVAGTPAYMAPEQARGEVGRLDERCDVFGLGAILCEILTGQPPYAGRSREEVARQAQQDDLAGAFARLDACGADADLLRLAKACLAPAPEDRPRDAGVVAREITAYLAGVQQRLRAAEVERAGALAKAEEAQAKAAAERRARRLTGAVLVMVLLAACGLGGAALLLRAAKEREHLARAKAETNLQLARDAVDKFFTKVGESPRLKAHDLEKLRRDLLEQARDFYEQFVQEPSAEPGVQAERGRAYSRLARITADIATNAEAIGLGQQAQEIFEQLARDHPDVPDYRYQLIKSFVDLGILYEDAGQLTRAQASFDQALPISEQLTRDYPGFPEYQHQLGNALYHQGFLHETGARLAEAKTAHERALSIFERLTRDFPKVTHYQTGLALTLRKLGGLLESNNQPKQAQAIYERAVPLFEQLARDHPDDPDTQHRLADMFHDLGMLHILMGNQAQAKASLETALPIRERLVHDHPTIGDYQWGLASTLNNIASLYKDSGEMAKAEAAFDKALPVCEKLVHDQPDVAKFQEFLVIIRQDCAGVRAIRGDHARATAEMEALTGKGPLTGMALYGAACVYALSSAAASKDVKLSQADRSRLCEQYAARALKLLEQTQAIGYFKTPARVEELKRDSDFDPLRSRDDFKKLLKELEKKANAGGK